MNFIQSCSEDAEHKDMTLNTNLAILEKRNFSLYQNHRSYSPSGKCIERATQSGYPTVLYFPSEGKPRYLHSPDNPVLEAENLLAGYVFRGEDLTILFGMGLGYLPLTIFNQMHPDHRLFIVENDHEIIHKALGMKPLKRLLSDDRVRLFHTNQVSDIFAELEKEQFRILGGKVNKLIYPASYELAENSYSLLENEIEQLVNMIKNNYLVLKTHSPMTVQNILENQISAIDSCPVDFLFGLAEKKPAMIVAAGPSLDKNIHLIEKFKQHFVIISVDAALKPLLSRKVRPDLLVSLDPISANLKKVDQIPSSVLKEIPLVYSPYVYPEIPLRFTGPKFVFNEHNRMSQWALGQWRQVSTLPYGFSVSHYAFYLARAMGADPIIFTGLDLAFSNNGRAHAENSADTWNIGNITRDFPRVNGINGKPIPTIHGFIHMITLFEQEISKTKALCIDATEGGAMIRGTKILSLQETIDKHAKKPISAISPTIQKLWEKNRTDRTGQILSNINWLRNQAQSVKKISRKALFVLTPLLEGIKSDRQDPSETKGSIEKVNHLSDQMSQHQKYKEIIKDRLPGVLVEQFQNKYRTERTTDPMERLKIDLEQSFLFFNEMFTLSEQIQEIGTSVLKDIASRQKIA